MEVDPQETWDEFVDAFCEPLIVKLKQILEEHKVPKIPVNVDDLQTELDPFDEGIIYSGVVRSCELSEKEDKNGNTYLTGIAVEVMEPEQFRGRRAFVNYMVVLPGNVKPQTELDLAFPRFVKAFKVPHDAEGFDPMDAIGCEGQFTVFNDEYQGRKTGRVKGWLL